MRLALATTIFAALCVLGIGFSRVLGPFDTGHYEGGLWAPAQLLIQGHNPYDLALTDRAPFVMSPYGPVYYAILGAGIRVWGLQFWFGRSVALAFLLFCAWLVARLVAIETSRRDWIWLGAGAFLSQLPVIYWAGMQRPDTVALAFSLSALGLALQRESFRAPYVLGAALCCVLAFFTRQTALLPMFIVALWHLTQRQYRAALGFIAVCGASITVICAALNRTSNGGFWWQQWTLSREVPLSLSNVLEHLSNVFLVPVALGLLALTLLGFAHLCGLRALRNEDITESKYRLLGFYLLLSTILAVITSSRDGANLNYYLEASAIGAVFGTWTLQRLNPGVRARNMCAFCCALSSFMGAFALAHEEQSRWQAVPYLRAMIRDLQQQRDSRPVYTVFPELAVAAGKPYWFNDLWQYDGRSPRHRRLFLEQMRQRQFSAVIDFHSEPPRGYQRHIVARDAPIPLYLNFAAEKSLP